MFKKGYKQSPEHIKKLRAARLRNKLGYLKEKYRRIKMEETKNK